MTLTGNARVAGVSFLTYIAAGLTSMAVGSQAQASDVLGIAMALSALLLGVTLYAITRDVDPDLAMIGLVCRVVESVAAEHPEVFFAAGSTIFCWLLLKGRLIPAALAWLGVVASVMLLVVLLVQLGGLLGGGRMAWSSSITWMVWMPMLIFELLVAAWLIARGVTADQTRWRMSAPSTR
jgi:hypothetical protein